MVDERSRNDALRGCGIVDPGVDASFDRLARLASGVTHAPMCAIVFGDVSRMLVKGYAGPEVSSMSAVLPPRELYEALLEASGPLALSMGDLAGVAIRAPTGTKLGGVFVRPAMTRKTTEDVFDELSDIVHLAENELALRAARHPEERAATILESMTDAFVFLDRNWCYTYVNKKAGEIFQRNPADLIGKHIWTEFPDGVGQPFYRAYYRAMEEQVFVQLEDFYPPWNRWFENRIYPTPDGLAIFFQDVTERRRAEQERRRLATIIETTTDLVAIANAEGGILFLNRAGRTLLGVPDDADLLSLHLVRLHALTSRDLLCDALPAAVKNGSWRGEAILVHKNGVKIPASELILWHPAQVPEGGYFSLVARDITERKRAEEEARKDAAVRTQAERMAHLGYWVWDLAPNRIRWSAELCRIYGFDTGSFDTSFDGYLARVHPQDRARVQQTIENAVRDHTAFNFEARILRPDGQVRHLRSWGTVHLDEAGQAAQVLGTSVDLTDLMLVTEELQRSAEWLGAALRNTLVAVWEWDLRTNEIRISEGMADVIGLRAEELPMSFDAYIERVHPDDVDALKEGLRVSVERGGDVDLEHRVLAADGSPRWLMVRSRASRDAAGRIDRLLGTLVDVTERHRGEAERRRLLEGLGRAQKLEAVGRLAAGAAHDFNNHLAIVQSSVDLLLRNPALDARARDAVLSIKDAAQNATTLTAQLLAFSRQKKGAFKLAPLNLNEVIENTCNLLRRLLPENIELELSLSPAVERVQADREQLERVLLNLVVNARDAMPGGGRITISTRERNGEAVFEIRDTGVGMTPEIQERIFEPFFTTKADQQPTGTGLGLATVYGIVSQTGGSIDVKSEPGAGTTFTIRLPFANSEKGET